MFAGALLASAAWAAAWFLLPREPAPIVDCAGRCGDGTACVSGRCEVAAAPAPEPETAPAKRKGKRGRRSGGGAAAGGAGGEEAPAEGEPPPPPFVPVDDSRIPEFSNAEPQALDLKAGNERLSEPVLDRHFAQVTPTIQGCVVTASRYGEVGAGSLRFKLRVLPSGKVESVSVTAPASLRVWGIPACARKAVFEHRFPAFDGAAMGVNFSVDVE